MQQPKSIRLPAASERTLGTSLSMVRSQLLVCDTDTILLINPKDGLRIVGEAAQLGITRVFIQPGAGSLEIERFCASNGMQVHHGCVLREL